MARNGNVQDDDVGGRPPRASAASGLAEGASRASAARKCEALLELFRGGAGSVYLGRLEDGEGSTEFVALRRLANSPTRELEASASLAQRVTHPKVATLFGICRDADAWYLASEYVTGITLFELGQGAVHQKKPVTAGVAVRIVLDALVLSAETERLVAVARGDARSLYPESIWISDPGDVFVSELAVASVLARTTTGASYVAVTAGMSPQAADVRAAAVELARLACARLMNGNPTAWHTPELPSALSELLARAISGGTGCETLERLANELSGLGPSLLASREEVADEIERIMGSERRRRRDELAALKGPVPDADATRVFRVAATAPLPGPEIASTADSRAEEVTLSAAVIEAPVGTPPPRPGTASSPSVNHASTIPAPPPPPPDPPTEVDSPISGVWREARARMGVPGRRSRPRGSYAEGELMTPAPITGSTLVAASAPLAAGTPPAGTKRVVLVVLIAVAFSALLGGAWFVRNSLSSNPAKPAPIR